MRIYMKKTSGFFMGLLFIFSVIAHADGFEPGETIFVSYPAANIKDDAFIIGKINRIMPNGDFKISVLDYVEGHDYGVSCVPIAKTESTTQNPNGIDPAWELWTDTKKLEKEKLDYLVPAKNVMKLGNGKTHFIERNNLYIVFGRWKSDAPMLSAERIIEAEKQARLNGLSDMIPAFEIAKLHRKSFYGDFGRPLQVFETVAPLVKALEGIEILFTNDGNLKTTWYAKDRDWKAIAKNTKQYFLIEAIDKVIDDANDQLHEEGIEKAAPEDIEQLKKMLSNLVRNKV